MLERKVRIDRTRKLRDDFGESSVHEGEQGVIIDDKNIDTYTFKNEYDRKMCRSLIDKAKQICPHENYQKHLEVILLEKKFPAIVPVEYFDSL